MGKFVLLSVVLLVFSYFVFRVVVRRDYQKKGRASVLSVMLEMAVFFFHANLFYTFAPYRWLSLPELPENKVLKVTSLILIFTGLALLSVAMLQLGYRSTLGTKAEKLENKGLYRYTRNPQVIAYGIFLTGWAMCAGSSLAIAWLILYAVVAHLMVITEEEHLLRTFGEPYASYCQKVPRYFKKL